MALLKCQYVNSRSMIGGFVVMHGINFALSNREYTKHSSWLRDMGLKRCLKCLLCGWMCDNRIFGVDIETLLLFFSSAFRGVTASRARFYASMSHCVCSPREGVCSNAFAGNGIYWSAFRERTRDESRLCFLAEYPKTRLASSTRKLPTAKCGRVWGLTHVQLYRKSLNRWRNSKKRLRSATKLTPCNPEATRHTEKKISSHDSISEIAFSNVLLHIYKFPGTLYRRARVQDRTEFT